MRDTTLTSVEPEAVPGRDGAFDSEWENRRLRFELEAERAGARELRKALELAASYFYAPFCRKEDETAWGVIVRAIRSDSGRDEDFAKEPSWWS